MSQPFRRGAALIAVCLLGAATPPLRAQNGSFENPWREFAQAYHRSMRENGVVGSSIWVLQNGRPVAREFDGFADLETRRAVDENTIFHWASITKTFTALAIMQLRDRGRLSLDDPIVKYLPELRSVHNPHGSMESITLRHLLTHSAGFRAGTWPWGGGEAWHPHEPTEWHQIVAMLPYTEILFAPGSRYAYSNPGIIFLGRVVEILSGDDFEVYVDKNIFKPLGMHASYFDVTPYHLLRHRSNNYTVRGGTPQANGLDFDTGITTSNSGLNAPITDMSRYLAFLIGDANQSAVYDDVLARSTLEEMWRARLPTTAMAGADSIGLVYFTTWQGPHRYIGHTGSQKAFQSFFYVDPAARTAVIAAFNTVGESGQKPDMRALMNEARARLFQSVLPALVEARRARREGG